MNDASMHACLAMLRAGGLCLVCDDVGRENEADFVGLGEYISPQSLLIMINTGRGLVCVPVGPARAKALGLEPMVLDNADPHGTAFTVSVDAVDCGTGISLADRLATIRTLAARQPDPQRLRRPGHLFPLVGRAGGLAVRRGHTEASLALAALAGSSDCAVICEVLADDGTMLRGAGVAALARELGIPLLDLETIRRWETVAALDGPVRIPAPGGDWQAWPLEEPCESLVMALGEYAGGDAPLVRIHSECLTGDVFASWRCDCGPQLQAAREAIAAEGRGLIFYLRQEGRGIGLHQKLRAYRLQEEGMDTLDANVVLGHSADARDYTGVARWLVARGIERIRLLSNNPAKVRALEEAGIVVLRQALVAGQRPENADYRRCKAERFGHWS